MLIQSNGGKEFLELAAKMRRAGTHGKTVRKALTASLQKSLKPAVQDVKHAAQSMTVKGKRGGGASARQRFDDAAEMRRRAKAAAKGRVARARRGASTSTGLRARVAAGVKSRVQYSGIRYGARVYVDPSNLPQSQRRLPRYLDSPKGWRHPVFGNREKWVAQYGEPYFAGTMQRHTPRIRREVHDAVKKAMRELQ